MPQVLDIQQFHGGNYYDQAEELIARSFKSGQGGFVQYAPVESPDVRNIDFDQRGIRKRAGSGFDTSVTGQSGEVVVNATTYVAVDGTISEILVGSTKVYRRDPGGAWTALLDSAGAAYSHAATVSKCTFARVDGHLFIGLDGTNYIQHYIGTAASNTARLEPEMVVGSSYREAYNVALANAVTGTWTQGAYIVANINSRLVYSVGDHLLEFTPMAHTAGSGIWNLAGTTFGFKSFGGEIRMITAFNPFFADNLKEQAYVGTSAGFEILTGFTAGDNVMQLEGSRAPLNHQGFCKSMNWLVYLTDDQNIFGINGTSVVDFGRRMRSLQYDAPLDRMSVTTANRARAFGYYNRVKKQAQFYFVTQDGPQTAIDTAVVLDFNLGEPGQQEALPSIEQRVRVLLWDKADNDWFSQMYASESELTTYGIHTGTADELEVYTNENALDDFTVAGVGGAAISARWKSPRFTARLFGNIKQWYRMTYRYYTRYSESFLGLIDGGFSETTIFDGTIDGGTSASTGPDVLDGGTSAIGEDSLTAEIFTQEASVADITETSVIRNTGRATTNKTTDIFTHSEALHFQLSNDIVGETFTIGGARLLYDIGAEIVN